ncbi:hypothetical protein TNCV_3983311 [Trichonephila clavipes]|nr:hypothetical protein TNCV_3983311 [Trichonephila clavipes]
MGRNSTVQEKAATRRNSGKRVLVKHLTVYMCSTSKHWQKHFMLNAWFQPRCFVMVWDAISSRGSESIFVLEGDNHRRPSLKHSRRSSSPYASDSLSGRTSCVSR